jgi:hypothetical protein
MIYLIIISSIILLFLLYFSKERYINYDKDNEYCTQEKTHALLAPNIPDDWKTSFLIGGKYCKPIKNKNLAPINGKYIFPKQRLLYDGIWNSDSEINNDIQKQDWNLIQNFYPIEGQYGANKYLHLPQKYMNANQKIIDQSLYYGDWNILNMKDKNMYNYDICNFDKNKNHIKGIMYIKPGISD